MEAEQNILKREIEYVEEVINEVFVQENKDIDIGEEKCLDLDKYTVTSIETQNEQEICDKTENLINSENKIAENDKITTKTSDPQHLRPFYFNKFPGTIHLVVEELSKVHIKLFNDDFIKIRIEVGSKIIESSEYSVEKVINPSFYVKIPIEGFENNLRVKIFILEPSSNRKIAQTEIEFDEKMINSIHNRLGEAKKAFKKIKGFFDFFSSNVSPVGLCKVYCGYLSKDEVLTINSPVPYSLLTLSKWLVARKYAYDLLFSGFLNIKGDLNDSTKYLWKLRYIKWFGYTLYIFNDKTKKIVSSINITDALIDLSNLHKGIIVFDLKTHVIEIHTDSKENKKKLRNVLQVLFPSNISLKSNKF